MPYIDKIQIGNTSYDIKDSTGGGGTVTGAYLPLAGGVMDDDASVMFQDSQDNSVLILEALAITMANNDGTDTTIGADGVDMTTTNGCTGISANGISLIDLNLNTALGFSNSEIEFSGKDENDNIVWNAGISANGSPGESSLTISGDSLTFDGIPSIPTPSYWRSQLGLGDAAVKGVVDSSSASAISTGTSVTTERDVYYGLPTINGVHTYNSSTAIYAPTAAGTNSYVLKSNGSGAPSWVSQSDLTAGTAKKLGVNTVGGSTQPIYLDAGTPTLATTYAGGTNVTLNGTNYSGASASFYAPTAAGSAGQVLMSNGSGAPTWSQPASIQDNDKRVEQNKSTSTASFPVLLTNTSNQTGTVTASVNYTTNVKISPSTGIIQVNGLTSTNGIAINIPNLSDLSITPTANEYHGAFDICTENGDQVGSIVGWHDTNNGYGIQFSAPLGNNDWNTLGLGANSSGNAYVWISKAANWRTALDIERIQDNPEIYIGSATPSNSNAKIWFETE